MKVWRTDPLFWEEHWQTYEGPLGSALDALCSADWLMDARPWLHVLVPYVASQLARGPEFEDRMLNRFGNAESLVDLVRDSTNAARLLEIQRLLTLVTVARWRLLHAGPGSAFLLNDRGWALWRLKDEALSGLLLPLSPDRALLLTPTMSRFVLFPSPTGWHGGLGHIQLTDSETRAASQAVARYALREIYGPFEAGLKDQDGIAEASKVEEPGDVFAPHGPLRIPGEYDWHRLAAFVGGGARLEQLQDPWFDTSADLPHRPVMMWGTNTASMTTSGIRVFRSEEFGDAVWLSTYMEAYLAARSPDDARAWTMEADFWLEEALRMKADELPPVPEDWGARPLIQVGDLARSWFPDLFPPHQT